LGGVIRIFCNKNKKAESEQKATERGDIKKIVTDLVGEHLVLIELLGTLAVLISDHSVIIGESVVDEGIAAELASSGIENFNSKNLAQLEKCLLQGEHARYQVAGLVAVGVRRTAHQRRG
jgi:hypothetical protein